MDFRTEQTAVVLHSMLGDSIPDDVFTDLVDDIVGTQRRVAEEELVEYGFDGPA